MPKGGGVLDGKAELGDVGVPGSFGWIGREDILRKTVYMKGIDGCSRKVILTYFWNFSLSF